MSVTFVTRQANVLAKSNVQFYMLLCRKGLYDSLRLKHILCGLDGRGGAMQNSDL